MTVISMSSMHNFITSEVLKLVTNPKQKHLDLWEDGLDAERE